MSPPSLLPSPPLPQSLSLLPPLMLPSPPLPLSLSLSHHCCCCHHNWCHCSGQHATAFHHSCRHSCCCHCCHLHRDHQCIGPPSWRVNLEDQFPNLQFSSWHKSWSWSNICHMLYEHDSHCYRFPHACRDGTANGKKGVKKRRAKTQWWQRRDIIRVGRWWNHRRHLSQGNWGCHTIVQEDLVDRRPQGVQRKRDVHNCPHKKHVCSWIHLLNPSPGRVGLSMAGFSSHAR